MRTVQYNQEDAEIPEDHCREGRPIGVLRAAVVTEAKTWIGTPFHHAARVKGAGVDCLMLLAEVYERAGVTAGRINPPFYVPDWHLHRDAERYMEGLLRYARPVDGAGAGRHCAVPVRADILARRDRHRMAAADPCLLVDRRRLG